MKKFPLFCLVKDKWKTTQKAHTNYDILCSSCKKHYIGKIDLCFATHLDEHWSQYDEPMF